MTYEAKLFAGKICKTTAHPRPCPSLFYFPGITSKPWHDRSEFNFVKYVESRFSDIKEEFLKSQDKIEKSADSSDKVDPFHVVKEGKCIKFPIVNHGIKYQPFSKFMPKTYKIFEELW